MEKKLSNKAIAVIAHADAMTHTPPAATFFAEADWRSFGLLAMGAARKDKKLALALFEQWKRLVCNSHTQPFISPMDGVYLGETALLLRSKADAKPLLAELFAPILSNVQQLFLQKNPFEDGIILLQNQADQPEPYAVNWEVEPGQKTQTPGYQTAILWSIEYLITLGYKLKGNVEELILDNELAVYSINEKMWMEEEGCYGALLWGSHQVVAQQHLAAFCPLACGAPTQEQAETLLNHLERTPWKSAINGLPLAGFPDADIVDLFLNWMIIKGLLRYEMYSVAARLRANILQNAEQNGIYEQYDYTSGAGTKNANSPYAAAIILDLLYCI